MDQYRGSQVGVVVQCEHGTVVSTSKYDEVNVFPDGAEKYLSETFWTAED